MFRERASAWLPLEFLVDILKLLRFCNYCCKSYSGFSSGIGTLLEIMSPPIIVYIPLLKISDLIFTMISVLQKSNEVARIVAKKTCFLQPLQLTFELGVVTGL